jgi:hypothetical protein
LLLVERLRVNPFEFVNASRPTVAEVAASLTVQLEFVTVGTVYEPIRVADPPAAVLSVIVSPLLFVKASLAIVIDVALSESVRLEFVTLGTV